MATAATMLTPDVTAMEAFLGNSLGESIHLVAIVPDTGDVRGRWFGSQATDAAGWAATQNRRGANVYWTVNVTRTGFTGKPKKTDIIAARFLHVDIDPPRDGAGFDRAAVVSRLEGLRHPPSFVLDSGNGVQAFWRLDELAQNLPAVEGYNRRLSQLLGGDHCHNIDRLMRLPGSVNQPDVKKAARGRVPAMAGVLCEDAGETVEAEAMHATLPELAETDRAEQAERAAVDIGGLEMTTLGKLGIRDNDVLAQVVRNGDPAHRSEAVMKAAGMLVRRGRFTDRQIAGLLLNPDYRVSDHLLDQPNPLRSVKRVIGRARSDHQAEPSSETKEASGTWGEPDMSVLRAGRSEAVPFPLSVLGSMGQLVQDLANGAGAPVDYVAGGLLAVSASLIGGKRWVSPWEGWKEPCILWAAMVGDPSSNKSPAIDAATDPLRLIEADHAELHKTVMMSHAAAAERAKAERTEWQSQVKAAAKEGGATPPMPDAAVEPDQPQRKRLLVQDTTPEALAELLAGNPYGTLHLRDEIAGWLDSFERYSPGGRSFWLEAYGGRPFVVDRKAQNGKPVVVPFTGVSVLGGIQPEKMRDALLGVADDGLVARFLWVWPEAIQYRRPTRVAAPGALEAIFRRLGSLVTLTNEPVILRLEPVAADVLEAWISENDAQVRQAAGLYAGWLGKARGFALRLSMVLELLGWATGTGPEPNHVSVAALNAALTLLEDYLKPHARRALADASLPKVEQQAAALARHIRGNGLTRVNLRDVRRDPSTPSLKVAEDVEAAAQALVEADWLRPAPSRVGGSAGRAKKDFEVNPAAQEAGRG